MSDKFKLVPVDPTHEMLSALTGEWHSSKFGNAAERYKAMLATAPEQPSPEEIRNGACKKCGQIDEGQTGEYPCVDCGLPILHDDVPERPDPADSLPDGWRLVEKETCYALLDGNNVVATLAGPDSVQNAAIIANALNSRPALPSGNSGELPSDKDLREFGGNEQFFLFCSEDEFLDIAKSVLRRFGQALPSCSQAEPSDTERDAARYRYLRAKVCIVGSDFRFINLPKPTYVAPSPWVEMDSVIDAAMRAEKEGS